MTRDERARQIYLWMQSDLGGIPFEQAARRWDEGRAHKLATDVAYARADELEGDTQ